MENYSNNPKEGRKVIKINKQKTKNKVVNLNLNISIFYYKWPKDQNSQKLSDYQKNKKQKT